MVALRCFQKWTGHGRFHVHRLQARRRVRWPWDMLVVRIPQLENRCLPRSPQATPGYGIDRTWRLIFFFLVVSETNLCVLLGARALCRRLQMVVDFGRLKCGVIVPRRSGWLKGDLLAWIPLEAAVQRQVRAIQPPRTPLRPQVFAVASPKEFSERGSEKIVPAWQIAHKMAFGMLA